MRLEADLKTGINPFGHYAPRGAQVDVIASTLPELLISGPAGTGKSRACLEKLNYCACRYSESRYLILRKTRSSLSDTGLVTFERDVLGLDNPMVTNGPQRHWRKSYRYYPSGAEIVIGGLDKPGKVLSAEYDLVFIQQAEEASLWDWEILISRLRNNRLPFQQILADCNPAAPTHWLRQRFIGGKILYLESGHKENPLLWDSVQGEWTKEGREYLTRLDSLTGSRKMRLRHGVWAQPEGAVYDIFDEERHVVRAFEPPALWPRVVGIDPFGAYIAAVWLAYDAQSQVLNVYREYYEPFGITTPGHVDNMRRLSQGETIFAWVGGGPSERQARADFQGAGIPLLEPPFGDVWAGIDRVYQLLRDFRLVIHDDCVNLLSQLGMYRRKMKPDGTVTENIEAKNDFHLPDALRYVVAWLTESRGQEVVYDPVRIW